METVLIVFALSFLVDEGCSIANVFNFKVLAIFWLSGLNWLVTPDTIDCNAVICVADDCIMEFRLLISFCNLSWISTSCWNPGLSLLSDDICAMLWVWMAVFLSKFYLFLFSDFSSTTSFVHFALLHQTAARRWFQRCRFDGEFDFWSLTWFLGFESQTDWHMLRHIADLCWLWRWLFKIEFCVSLLLYSFLLELWGWWSSLTLSSEHTDFIFSVVALVGEATLSGPGKISVAESLLRADGQPFCFASLWGGKFTTDIVANQFQTLVLLAGLIKMLNCWVNLLLYSAVIARMKIQCTNEDWGSWKSYSVIPLFGRLYWTLPNWTTRHLVGWTQFDFADAGTTRLITCWSLRHEIEHTTNRVVTQSAIHEKLLHFFRSKL